MPETVNTTIQDAITERDVYLDRYKRGVIVRILKLLGLLEESVVQRINALDPMSVQPRYRDARLTRLLAEVGAQVDDYADKLNKATIPDFNALAKDEGAFQVQLIKGAVPVALDFVAPSAANLRAAAMSRPFSGKHIKEWVADQPALVRAKLRAAIRQGVAEGQTVQQLTTAVRGTAASGYTDGVMEITRRSAQALVRTSVNHVVTAARETTYADNADIIKGVRWVSTLDGRTSLICISLDGKVFPMNKGPRPPAHPNCRSSTAPVLKSWKELGINLADAPAGTRASMDGQVGEDKTYGDWLKGRTVAFQDDVLGKTRAELFRKGGLTVDKFSDASGHVYDLDMLRKKQPEAFARAGL